MITYFAKASGYLQGLNMESADPLDKKAFALMQDEQLYEKASQALRRRFSRGATEVDGIDRNGRLTRIKRDRVGGLYEYFIQGGDGNWFKPDERIWVVASYALWQDTK